MPPDYVDGALQADIPDGAIRMAGRLHEGIVTSAVGAWS
jgi:hypothetical protein